VGNQKEFLQGRGRGLLKHLFVVLKVVQQAFELLYMPLCL